MTGRISRIQHVSVLVFRVMGVRIGIDTDQLSGVTDVANVDEKKCKLLAMHELLGLERDESPLVKVVFAKGGYLSDSSEYIWMRRERHIGLLVGNPEDIIEVPLDDMRPLPQLIHSCTNQNGFWAVGLMPDEMIFMADIRKMIGSKAGDVMWVK